MNLQMGNLYLNDRRERERERREINKIYVYFEFDVTFRWILMQFLENWIFDEYIFVVLFLILIRETLKHVSHLIIVHYTETLN